MTTIGEHVSKRDREREREKDEDERRRQERHDRKVARERRKLFRVRATAYGLYRGDRICMTERLKGCYGNAVSLLT